MQQNNHPDNIASRYGLDRWGADYFGINDAGHVAVYPTADPTRQLDLYELVQTLRKRGVQSPMILRFSDILRHRVDTIAAAFQRAHDQAGYPRRYRCVYPIKVNQQRHVVETIHEQGLKHGFGLEVGSKAELLAVLGTVTDDQTPLICNGFKDRDYLTAAMGAAAAGMPVTVVIEWLEGLEEALAVANEVGVRPRLGLRVRLRSSVQSRWEDSSGRHAKFGLTPPEVETAVERLRAADAMGDLHLLHFHAGSQISDLTGLGDAVAELAGLYLTLREQGAALDTLDVGGGLGVDYAGTRVDGPDSMNYNLDDYAEVVVSRIATVMRQHREIPPQQWPTILSESGRALTASSSVTVFDVLGTANDRDRLATYFVNASLFQSLPDAWAIGQRFPIMPIHRLNETPTHQGTLADITCDSDGKIESFVTGAGFASTLPLHDMRPGEPYVLGAFFTGAYQEILGDLHNLFGDETLVHVSLDARGAAVIDRVIEADPICEVLSYVDYDPKVLEARFTDRIRRAEQAGMLSGSQASALIHKYHQSMSGTTYLD